MPQTEFEVLDKTEATDIHEAASTNGHRPLSPITKALLEGQTVFLIGKGSYGTKTFEKMGKKLKSMRGERNGKNGVYVWLVEIE